MAIGADLKMHTDEKATPLGIDEVLGRKHVLSCYSTEKLKITTNTMTFKQDIDGYVEELVLTTPDFIKCSNSDERYELFMEIYEAILSFDEFIEDIPLQESNFYYFGFKVKDKDYKMELACATADGNITRCNVFFAIFSLLLNLGPMVKHDLAISAEYYYQRAKIETRDQIKRTKISERFIWYLNREKYIEDFITNISNSFRGLYIKFIDDYEEE